MSLFRKPKQKIFADVDIAVAARDKIAARLAQAERLLSDRHAAVRALAADDATDEILDAAEAQMRAAADRLATLQDALTDADAHVREAEHRRDTAENQKRRAETAAVIDEVAEGLGTIGGRFAELMKEMSALTERAALITPDANGLNDFCRRAIGEIPESAALLSELLHNLAKATLSGNAPATLPLPEQPTQPAHRAPPPATTRVFAVKPFKWLDANGDVRTQPEFFDVDLTPALAERAIELGVAVPLDHPRRRQMHGTARVYRPDPDHCISLDGDAAQPKPRPQFVQGVPIEPMPIESGAKYHASFGV